MPKQDKENAIRRIFVPSAGRWNKQETCFSLDGFMHQILCSFSSRCGYPITDRRKTDTSLGMFCESFYAFSHREKGNETSQNLAGV